MSVVIHGPSEQCGDSPGAPAARLARLLGELGPNMDLASLVERVARQDLPWVVVSTSAIAAWERRDPTGWERVSEWLAAQGVAIVRT
jgi:hypothetical protein